MQAKAKNELYTVQYLALLVHVVSELRQFGEGGDDPIEDVHASASLVVVVTADGLGFLNQLFHCRQRLRHVLDASMACSVYGLPQPTLLAS